MLSFVYDDDGNRIQKKDHRTNAVSYYSYDGSGTLAAIFEQQGTGPIQLTCKASTRHLEESKTI